MIHELFSSASDFCTSLLFNNPGKIKEACFGRADYSNPVFNPCTGAIFGMAVGAIGDALGLTGASAGAVSHGSVSTGGAGIGAGGDDSFTQPSLSDLLPEEYKSGDVTTLSDVLD